MLFTLTSFLVAIFLYIIDLSDSSDKASLISVAILCLEIYAVYCLISKVILPWLQNLVSKKLKKLFEKLSGNVHEDDIGIKM